MGGYLYAAGSVQGSSVGKDTLVIDDSRLTNNGYGYFNDLQPAADGTGDLTGRIEGLNISNINDLTFKAGSGNDYIDFDVTNTAAASSTPFSSTMSLDGGAGHDTLVADFTTFSNPVILVEHADGSSTSNLGSFTNFEALVLTGTAGNDVLGGPGTILGEAGDDILSGGPGDSADRLNGGGGIDTVSYADAQAGVQVSLAKQGAAQNTVGAGIDRLVGFENLTGSSHDDVLTGYKHGNILDGGAGNDHLDGGGGGIDTASYADATAAVTVSLATTSAQNTGGAGTDTLVNFENLIGSS